ncbi:hypothetical protein C8F04DRAFT_248847 [Mycena alexandri]|uniref:Uncharacterized protein n=1 Tax=Mycena alexandri TaxID=1745969 RepID=A0AAD6T6F2_9AGAR|nr:hypothetical protein C8F04DRAFT_248847 [Mycena alexandri]
MSVIVLQLFSSAAPKLTSVKTIWRAPVVAFSWCSLVRGHRIRRFLVGSRVHSKRMALLRRTFPNPYPGPQNVAHFVSRSRRWRRLVGLPSILRRSFINRPYPGHTHEAQICSLFDSSLPDVSFPVLASLSFLHHRCACSEGWSGTNPASPLSLSPALSSISLIINQCFTADAVRARCARSS